MKYKVEQLWQDTNGFFLIMHIAIDEQIVATDLTTGNIFYFEDGAWDDVLVQETEEN